ncbi:MAG: hypothetical protein Q4P09_05365 [Phascolarctobacterium sp.]|nr:hypothetical protein [Phascolarctobacterium sp.]
MREIGGYIELDNYRGTMLYHDAVLLNCGRNALAYLIKARGIKRIFLPYYLCDSVTNVCKRYGVTIKYYHIGDDWLPAHIDLEKDDWLYIVNYYGQISNSTITSIVEKFKNVIVDNAQAYFQEPVDGVDTLYTCRKYFGVPDGAVLYTSAGLNDPLVQDVSFDRMRFLLGRYEKTASEFYDLYVENNHLFTNEPIKTMSKITRNLLCGLDYDFIRKRRTNNFRILHSELGRYNKLRLTVPKGAFMYPFYIDNGYEIRKKLQEQKIYIPLLWPYVMDVCDKYDIECDMAKNILPLPVDQRYGDEDMKYIYKIIIEILKKRNILLEE